MKVAIHAGHNPDGKIGCGAVGIMKESTAAREIVKDVMEKTGLEMRDVTVNDGKSQADVLNVLVRRINEYRPNLSLSVHLNAYGAASANGVEVYTLPGDKAAGDFANTFLAEMEKLGYRNRGVKNGSHLRMVNSPDCSAVLLECGFVTSPNDCRLYNAGKIADAILKALGDIGRKPEEEKKKYYRVISGSFSNRELAIKRGELLKEHGFEYWVEEYDGN